MGCFKEKDWTWLNDAEVIEVFLAVKLNWNRYRLLRVDTASIGEVACYSLGYIDLNEGGDDVGKRHHKVPQVKFSIRAIFVDLIGYFDLNGQIEQNFRFLGRTVWICVKNIDFFIYHNICVSLS